MFIRYDLSFFLMIIKSLVVATAVILVFTWFSGSNHVVVAQKPLLSSAVKSTNKENSPFHNASGTIASLQNDQASKPTWIVSGKWTMTLGQTKTSPIVNKTSNNASATSNSQAIFNASFAMIKLDGSEKHSHTISNFKMLGNPINNNMTITFNGTSTVSMKDGPRNDVPVSIKIMDRGAIAISLDPTKVENHFGNTPIYGNVYSRH
jgi:hypothetical protein